MRWDARQGCKAGVQGRAPVFIYHLSDRTVPSTSACPYVPFWLLLLMFTLNTCQGGEGAH